VKFLPLLLVLGLWLQLGAARLPTAAQTAGAILNFPSVQCQGQTTTVAFSWQPLSSGAEQWLDLSIFDDGFQPGTFLASGPHDPTTNTVAWTGILAGVPHFWRVNTVTPSGWMPSATGTFVPCGAPVLLWGPLTCDVDGSARVQFRWSPATPAASQQWLDLAKDDARFAPGTFFGSGPLDGRDSELLMTQIHGSTQFYFRINALTANGWQASQTGGFLTACAQSQSPLPVGLVQARVVRVIDGDTVEADIVLGPRVTIRYIGVDTPETVAPGQPVACYGIEASNRNKALVENQTVYLEKDISETDRFGRLLRYVYLESGAMVNELLVADGFAQVSTFPPDVKYQQRLLAAQQAPRAANRGLWGSCVTATPPPAPGGGSGNCDPAYPTVCIPPPPPDLDCGQITYRRFTVLPPDPHRFDGSDNDGIGCETS
jgi:micrococcal nuclease